MHSFSYPAPSVNILQCPHTVASTLQSVPRRQVDQARHASFPAYFWNFRLCLGLRWKAHTMSSWNLCCTKQTLCLNHNNSVQHGYLGIEVCKGVYPCVYLSLCTYFPSNRTTVTIAHCRCVVTLTNAKLSRTASLRYEHGTTRSVTAVTAFPGLFPGRLVLTRLHLPFPG